MKTTDIIDNFSDLDRVRFTEHSQYTDYFNFIKITFNCLLESLKKRSSDNPIEIPILKNYLQKYLNTIELLKLKYLFDEDNKMAIDLSDSSFPNYLEFKKMEAELEKLPQLTKGLPSSTALKQQILDYFFQKKAQPITLLQKLGKAEYYQALGQPNYMKGYNHGDIFEISKTAQGTPQYIYSWASYDSMSNRPHIYLLVFEFTNSTIDVTTEGADTIKALIQKINHDSSPLSVIAKDIDDTYESIKPKVLKRIDIGPIYCKYSKENHPISQLIQNQFTDDDFAFFYTTEIVHSVGEKKITEGSFFNKKSSLRQVFFVDHTDKDSLERSVSKVDKYLISTHGLAQYLRANMPQYTNNLTLPPITF